jgi:xanthine dehydrogenase YagS FAD-binding subunit
MELFEYIHASNTKEAIGMLGSSWDAAAVLAGGTDILSLMKEHVMTPKRVVNIKGIAELAGIHPGADGLTIGALTTIEELRTSADVRTGFPALAHAAEGITSPQMRNMGTVGGDLCQRPRCWYFRNGFGLLATDEGGKALVPGGENRYHAIFGNDGPAYFVSASSLGPAFVALSAKIHIQGPGGIRVAEAKDFFVIPKSASDREIALKPNEILTHIVIPVSSRGMRSATYEVRQKLAMDWPLAAASVAVKVDAGTVSVAHIVLGHVAPMPWHAERASKWLVGQTLNEKTAAEAGEAAIEGAKPLSQNGYKVQLSKVAVKRALIAASKGGA